MMKLNLILLTIMIVVAPNISFAFGGKSLSDGLFWGADLDRNERIDRNEAKSTYNLASNEIFTRFDKDGNGFISQTEFNDFIQQAPWTDS